MDALDELITADLPDLTPAEAEAAAALESEETEGATPVEPIATASEQDQGSPEELTEGAAEEEAPATPDGTPAEPAEVEPVVPAPTPPAQPAQPDPTAEELKTTRAQLAASNTLNQRLIAESKKAAAYAQLEAKRAEWAAMDPEDAKVAQLEFVQEVAAGRISELETQLTKRDQATADEAAAREGQGAKEYSINIVMQRYGLNADDREILAEMDTPQAMVKYGEKAKGRRQGQTQAARTQRAENLAANKALTPGTTGGAVPAARRVPANIDELVDDLFAVA